MLKINSIALTAALCGFSGYANAAELCHPAFNGGTTYGAGDTVSASSTVETTTACTCGDSGCPTSPGQTSGCEKTTSTTEVHNYVCVSGANSAYCSMAGFEPTGLYSSQAWTKASDVCTVSSIQLARPSLAFLDESQHSFSIFQSFIRVPTFPLLRPPLPPIRRLTLAARAPTSPARTTPPPLRSPSRAQPILRSTSARPPQTTCSAASPATSPALVNIGRPSGRPSAPARERSLPRPVLTSQPSRTLAGAPTFGRLVSTSTRRTTRSRRTDSFSSALPFPTADSADRWDTSPCRTMEPSSGRTRGRWSVTAAEPSA